VSLSLEPFQRLFYGLGSGWWKVSGREDSIGQSVMGGIGRTSKGKVLGERSVDMRVVTSNWACVLDLEENKLMNLFLEG